MIVWRCDNCHRVMENPKQVVLKSTPVILANGFSLNPEDHLCTMCLKSRLSVFCSGMSEDSGKYRTIKESENAADEWVKDAMIKRPDVVNPIDPVASISPPMIMNAPPIPLITKAPNGAHDTQTLFKRALDHMNANNVPLVDVTIYNSFGFGIGTFQLAKGTNIWSTYKILSKSDFVSNYTKTVILDDIEHSKRIDCVWEKLKVSKTVLIKPYLNGKSCTCYLGQTRSQVADTLNTTIFLKDAISDKKQIEEKTRIPVVFE